MRVTHHLTMEDELVLLTSYFNLVGGRMHDHADTFRVETSLPSATSPDGVAAFYVVTESTTGGNMGSRARRLAVDTLTAEYVNHSDVPPATRLKSALKSCHEVVHQEFEGHVSVGAGVIVVERDTIYLAQVGPSHVFVLHEGGLTTMDLDVDERSPFSRALGSFTGPKIAVYRDQLGQGDVFALTSSALTKEVELQDVQECFGAGTADDIGECILRVVKASNMRDCTAIIIEAALSSELEADGDDEPVPSFMEQVDSAVSSLAGVGKMVWKEFRTVPPPEIEDDPIYGRRRLRSAEIAEDGATPTPQDPDQAEYTRPSFRDDATMEVPAVLPQELEQRSASERTPEDFLRHAPTFRDGATEEMPAVETEASALNDATREQPAISPDSFAPDIDAAEQQARDLEEIRQRRGKRRGARSIIRQGRRQDTVSAPEPEPKTGRGPAFRTELEQVNARIQSDPDIGDAVPPVQAFPDTSTEPSRIYATSKDIKAVNRRPRRFGGAARPVGSDPLSGTPVIRPSNLGDIDLRRSVSRPVSGPLVWAGVVACFLLFAVALLLYLNHRKRPVAVNPYPRLVQKDIALAVGAKRSTLADVYLQKARYNLTLAGQHGSTKTYVQRMQGRIQTTADTLHRITRVVAPVTLADFSKFPSAHPASIATANGLVFVLDSGRKSVFSVTPNATSNPVLVVQDGEQDSGFTIGLPQRITSAGGTALALDDHNVLVRATGAQKTATSLTAGAPNQKVVAIANTGADVYLLDSGSSQLWRYPFGVAGFNPSPQAFFTSNKPDLTKATSFVFDSTSLYVLDTRNSIHKFDILTANPQTFTVHARTPLKGASAVITDVGLNYVWVIDPVSGRIIQMNKTGNYVRTYVSGSGAMNLRNIQSAAVGPNGHTLFVLIGSKVFDFPVRP